MTAAGVLPPSARPRGRRDRLVGLGAALWTLVRVELVVRRRPPEALCREFGLRFAGFEDLAGREPEVLPHDVLDRWWAVEAVLRWWPWARRRPCLRRSLVLGFRLRALHPVLHLEVRRLEPFVAHAFLDVRGNRLDTGDADSMRELGMTA